MTGGLRAALAAAFLAGIFLLAFCKVEDNDAFMHLSMGREIWSQRAIPETEPFLAATRGAPLSDFYRSWLFGLVTWVAFLCGGIPGVVILKAGIVTLCFAVLLLDALLPRGRLLVALCALSFVAILVRPRMVERPDTVFFLSLAFTIYALRAYLHRGSKLIRAVPLVHLLWANCHTSISVMAVPFAAVLLGGVLQRLAARHGEAPEGTPTPRQLRVVLLVFFASFAASLLTPYGLGQYTFGARFLGVEWYRQEIAELRPPTWATSKETFVLAAAVALSFVASRRRFPLVDLALVAPFFGLAFTSVRFFFVAAVVSGPVLARNLAAAAGRVPSLRSPLPRRLLASAAVLWLLAYPALVIADVRELGSLEQRFGVGINDETVPEGALAYLDRVGHAGTVLNTFQWGGYVVWRDFPRRWPFHDARGSLPIPLLEKVDRARSRTATLDELSREWAIEALLLQYPVIPPGAESAFGRTDPALSHPGWALVYWDDVSLVYLRRAGPLGPVAERDEYRLVRPAQPAESLRRHLGDEAVEGRLFAELERNIRETSSYRARLLLGFVLNEKGRCREALDAFSPVRPHALVSVLPAKLAGMGFAYSRLGEDEKALSSYREAIRLTNDPFLMAKVAGIHEQRREWPSAVRALERASALAPRNPAFLRRLASAHEAAGDRSAAERDLEALRNLAPRLEGEEHFRAGLAAYGAGRLDEAREAFLRSLAAHPASAPALSNLGFVLFDLGRLDEALEAQGRALDVDPLYANAHYGLAQTYRKLGRRDPERRHWEEYLRLEPKGYFSRRAREALDGMGPR